VVCRRGASHYFVYDSVASVVVWLLLFHYCGSSISLLVNNRVNTPLVAPNQKQS